MKKRIMIVGPYGGINLGDDLILYQILEEISEYDVEITVSCSSPEVVAEVFGVKTCSLLEYRRRETESLRRVREMDLVIIGGGEQLSEPRVITPIWGHLARTAHICRVARKHGVPVMLWAVGLDALRSRLSKTMVRHWVLRSGVTACLRDQDSFQRASDIMKRDYSALKLVADPAYSLRKVPPRSLPEETRNALGLAPGNEKRLLVVPAFDKHVSLDYVDELVKFCRVAESAGFRVYGWTTDLQRGYDDVLLDMPAWTSLSNFSWIERLYISPDKFASFISEFDLVVSARMHPIIVAQTQEILSFVLARSAKMKALMDRFTIAGQSIEKLEFETITEFLLDDSKARFPVSDELLRARQDASRCKDIFVELISGA